MDQSEIQLFSARWIELQKRFQNGDLHDDDPDWEIIFDLMRNSGEDGDWRVAMVVCVEIAHQSGDPEILDILGASPLEDLLEYHGDKVLPDFLAAAKDNPSFRQALRHIWPREDKQIWARFEAIRDHLELPDA